MGRVNLLQLHARSAPATGVADFTEADYAGTGFGKAGFGKAGFGKAGPRLRCGNRRVRRVAKARGGMQQWARRANLYRIHCRRDIAGLSAGAPP
jgi:hypothetical protein